jgi:hypothetical protein
MADDSRKKVSNLFNKDHDNLKEEKWIEEINEKRGSSG